MQRRIAEIDTKMSRFNFNTVCINNNIHTSPLCGIKDPSENKIKDDFHNKREEITTTYNEYITHIKQIYDDACRLHGRKIMKLGSDTLTRLHEEKVNLDAAYNLHDMVKVEAQMDVIYGAFQDEITN